MFYTTTSSTNYTSSVTEYSRTYMIIIFILNFASVFPANDQNKNKNKYIHNIIINELFIIIFIMNLASVIPANKQNKKIKIKCSTQQHHQQIIHHP